MAKYKTTSLHPELKEGIELEYIGPGPARTFYIEFSEVRICITDDLWVKWQTQDWIKEIQEPKWTDDDMMDFAIHYKENASIINNVLDHWKEANNRHQK